MEQYGTEAASLWYFHHGLHISEYSDTFGMPAAPPCHLTVLSITGHSQEMGPMLRQTLLGP
jgi:hypothetical protein